MVLIFGSLVGELRLREQVLRARQSSVRSSTKNGDKNKERRQTPFFS
jgi:hypothetical protein